MEAKCCSFFLFVFCQVEANIVVVHQQIHFTLSPSFLSLSEQLNFVANPLFPARHYQCPSSRLHASSSKSKRFK